MEAQAGKPAPLGRIIPLAPLWERAEFHPLPHQGGGRCKERWWAVPALLFLRKAGTEARPTSRGRPPYRSSISGLHRQDASPTRKDENRKPETGNSKLETVSPGGLNFSDNLLYLLLKVVSGPGSAPG